MEPPEQRRPAIDSEHFDVLADSERRHALRVLSTTDGRVDLNTLAVMVAARELGTTTSEVAPRYVERYEIALYHNHLSRMEEYGILRFDANDRTVELRDSPEAAAALETVSGLESR